MSAETRIRNSLQRLVDEGRVPGIQYVAADAGDLRVVLEAGTADLRENRRVDPSTTFMACSTTKVVTAAAVLQLVERGKLNLEDPVSRHTAHPYDDKITIRHLLAQTSGIPNPLPLRWIHRSAEHGAFDEKAAFDRTIARHSRPLFSPGARYSYSNISYWLLGRVVEAVTGARFENYVQENILTPLGLDEGAAGFRIDLRRHATGYQKLLSPVGLFVYLMVNKRILDSSDGGFLRFHPVYMDGPAYGGLICTSSGFARFLQDMLSPHPCMLSPRSKEQFFTPQDTNDGTPSGMTLGWRTGNLQGEPYFGKAGGGPGFQSNARIYPRLGMGSVWLANHTGVNERDIHAVSDTLDIHWLDRPR